MNCKKSHNKRIELTTKAEPIFRKFKVLGGFCVSSSLALNRPATRGTQLTKASEGIDLFNKKAVLDKSNNYKLLTILQIQSNFKIKAVLQSPIASRMPNTTLITKHFRNSAFNSTNR